MSNRVDNINTCVIDHSVVIQNGQYGKWSYQKNREPEFVPMGAAVYLEKILITAETSERVLILSFQDAKGKEITVEFERKKLTEQGIMDLLANGVQVTKKSAGTLIASIQNQEPDVDCETRHRELGFREFEGKQVFFGSEGIGVESIYSVNCP